MAPETNTYKQIQTHLDKIIAQFGSEHTAAILSHIRQNSNKYAKIDSKDISKQQQILVLCMKEANATTIQHFSKSKFASYKKVYAYLTNKYTDLSQAEIGNIISNKHIHKYIQEMKELIEKPQFNKPLFELLETIEPKIVAQLKKKK